MGWLRWVVPALVFSATGCSGGVELRAAGGQASAPLTLTLVNGTTRNIGYNLCLSHVQRQVDGAWTDVPDADDRVCTMELRMLQPFGEVSAERSLPAGAGPGTYRAQTGVEVAGTRQTVTSGPVVIE